MRVVGVICWVSNYFAYICCYKTYIMEDKKNKPELSISEYGWEGEIEYTYEIRGYNVYFSKVGFKTYEDAQKEGEVKLKKYT